MQYKNNILKLHDSVYARIRVVPLFYFFYRKRKRKTFFINFYFVLYNDINAGFKCQ